MARYVPIAIIVALASPGWGQSAGPYADAPQPAEQSVQSQSFGISHGTAVLLTGNPNESRIFAGTEVAPNAMVGIGMFGFKGEKSMHAPVTARDLATNRSRKAAVGFSLRF